MSSNELSDCSLYDANDSFFVWLTSQGIDSTTTLLFQRHSIDNVSFSLLNEGDLREIGVDKIGIRKRIMCLINQVRTPSANFSSRSEFPYILRSKKESSLNYLRDREASVIEFGTCIDEILSEKLAASVSETFTPLENFSTRDKATEVTLNDIKNSTRSVEHRKKHHARLHSLSVCEEDIKLWKVALSAIYAFLSLGLTSFVMVLAHERLPEMSKYPPLPDILLDNLPYIPWAFEAAEIVCILLFSIWLLMLLFHRHRFIIIRRFCSLIGTVFILRSVTMFITSLSVPGQHLMDHCQPFVFHTFRERFSRACDILFGMGMSLQGVRTCGDYMFSGHTTVITMFNFFITEYTPPTLQSLHTFTWILNIFGIFFILAAHEHYSIDVFVAMYITSRLFLYYHWAANNHFLMQRDQNRARICFPMFSFFESEVRGVVPPEFSNPFKLTSFLSRKRLRSAMSITNLAVFVKIRQHFYKISGFEDFHSHQPHDKST